MLAFTIIKGLINLLLTTKTKRSGVTGYLAVGSNGFEDYVAMGSGLRQHGYPAPDSDLNVAIGGGGYSQIGRLVVGGQGEGGGSTAEDAYLISSVGSGGGFGVFGWLLIDSAWLRVYPLVGVGGRGSGVSVRPKNNTSRGVSLGSGGANLVAGVGLEVRIPFSRSFRPMIGAQIGWQWQPAGGWQGDLSVEPEELGLRPTSAPYMRVLIGLGG